MYVNPGTAPTHVNQTWDTVGSQGAVWGVTDAALPSLLPGGVLTLTTRASDPYYQPGLSHVVWPLVAGTPIYAQVDSADVFTTYGAILENHEITGGPHNKVKGPVHSTVAVGQLLALSPTTDNRQPTSLGNLPPRP